MTIMTIGPEELIEVMAAFRDSLQEHQGTINRLNVFPVPDGDTGTNMLLTLESVCSEIDGMSEAAPEMAAVCAAIAKGSLMGARGNSGVILCQVLRALTADFTGASVGAMEFAKGMANANEAARSAVSRPVEGTILTVAKEAAAGAMNAVDAGADLVGVLRATSETAVAALASTPKLLSVLQDAGVVDAGGAGLTLLYKAFLHVVAGTPALDALELPAEVAAVVASTDGKVMPVLIDHDLSSGGPQYEVMFLLESEDHAIPALRATFDAIGDSTVIVGASPTFSCHVHTDDIGAAIEAGIVAGRPHEIRVTDLREQVGEERWVREAAGELEPQIRAAPPRTSVVAVASGPGVRQIFLSLGVDRLVAGGQSMNPSTADILDMAESAPGSEVVLLPNNKNIIPVANQVVELSTKKVVVVPTLGIQEGFAALLAYDPAEGATENAQAMGEMADGVVAGEVTQAIRDATGPTGAIHEGDWLGLSRSGIEVVESTFLAAATALIEALLGDDHEIVTLIAGSGADAAVIDEIAGYVTASHPSIAVERHLGNQPLYPLLISIE
jgi:DAK2 domain fusion protein YloV